jgi:hypothetical protein
MDITKQETVGDWLNRTHKERYDKTKSYCIINPRGDRLISECSSLDVHYPQWWINDVLYNRIVVEVEETETQIIVTARKLGRG